MKDNFRQMKKLSLVAVLLLSSCFAASANSILGIFNVGGRVGVTSSRENLPTADSGVVEIDGLGWTGTVFARVNLPKLPLYVQPELQYTSTTITIPMLIDNSQSTEQHTYIDLPILVGAEFGLGGLVSMRLHAGPVFAIASEKGFGELGKDDFVDAYNTPVVNWTAGVGVKFLSLIAEVRYNGNFVDGKIQQGDLLGSVDTNYTSWNVSLGLMF